MNDPDRSFSHLVNSELAKLHWRHLNISFSIIIGPISIKLFWGQRFLVCRGLKFLQLKDHSALKKEIKWFFSLNELYGITIYSFAQKWDWKGFSGERCDARASFLFLMFINESKNEYIDWTSFPNNLKFIFIKEFYLNQHMSNSTPNLRCLESSSLFCFNLDS